MTTEQTPITADEPEMTLEEAERILAAFVAALQEIDAQRSEAEAA